MYITTDLLRLSAVHDVNITDIKLPYWKVQETSESVYGVTAKLHSIRLLDVKFSNVFYRHGNFLLIWILFYAAARDVRRRITGQVPGPMAY